jgi:hypothetical protein
MELEKFQIKVVAEIKTYSCETSPPPKNYTVHEI